mgnify:CR=1 FL=1
MRGIIVLSAFLFNHLALAFEPSILIANYTLKTRVGNCPSDLKCVDQSLGQMNSIHCYNISLEANKNANLEFVVNVLQLNQPSYNVVSAGEISNYTYKMAADKLTIVQKTKVYMDENNRFPSPFHNYKLTTNVEVLNDSLLITEKKDVRSYRSCEFVKISSTNSH